jgi:hypothetical protein
MTAPEGGQPDTRTWAAKWRDGILLLLGVAMLAGETVGSLVYGRPADTVIIGAAIAIVGIVPVLQRGAA